jgi:hypothetical protein
MIDGFYTPQSRSKSTGGATKRDVSVWQKQQAADVTPVPRPTYIVPTGKGALLVSDAKPYVPVGMSSEQQHIAQANYGASDATTILVPNPAKRSTLDAYKSAYGDYTRYTPELLDRLGISVASPEWTQSLVNGVENGTVILPTPDWFAGPLPPPRLTTALDPLVPGWESYSGIYAAAVWENPIQAAVNGPNCNPCGPRGNGAACADYYIASWVEVISGGGKYDTPIEDYDWCGE